jgi:small-conductance mechanosensitive channel
MFGEEIDQDAQELLTAAGTVALRIALIVGLALVARWLVRRAISRMVRRAANGDTPTLLRPLPERVRATLQEATAMVPPERRRQRAEAIGSVLRSTITAVIFVIALLMILDLFEINLAPLLAGAGVVGVALGFGAQTLVRDLLAGLFMLLEDQYGVGDVIDVGEASGVVEAVGLRITTLRDLQGVFWYVPNGEIRRVGNRTQGAAGVVVDVPIGFAPVAEAVEALRRAAQALADDPELHDELVEPPEVLGVEQITVNGAVVRTVARATPEGQWRVGRELRRRQTEALIAAGLADQILAARILPGSPGTPGGQP